MSEGNVNGLEHIRALGEQTQGIVVQLMDQMVAMRKSMTALEQRMDAGQKELRDEVGELRGEVVSMRNDFTRRFDVQRDETRLVRTTVGKLFGHVETEFAGMEARMERRSLAREVTLNEIVSERIVPLEERVEALEKQVREPEAG